jgi:predicted esterase
LHFSENIAKINLRSIQKIERRQNMKTILEELYDGQIFPDELIVPKNPEYRQLNREISAMKETWHKKLSETDYQSLESFLQLYCRSNALESAASFVYGFKLGAMIMLEVSAGKGELVGAGE